MTPIRKARSSLGRAVHGLALVGLAVLATGCLPGTRARPVPMPQIEPLMATDPACLVVLLPGAFDRPEDFVERGVVADLEGLDASLRVLAPDAHLGYYRSQEFLERFDEDVFGPAVAELEDEDRPLVYAAGVSMGGVGSLLYAMEGEVPVDRIVLLAPFLGNRKTLRTVREAGGPLAWQPPETIPQEEWGLRLWSWLKTGHDNATLPEIWLAYGTDDRLAGPAELLTELLPPERVFTRPGGHNWKTWRPLWQDLLAAGAFGDCVEP